MTHAADSTRVSQPQQSRRSSFRPEIQALRAAAVLLVVLFHLWPNRLPGGYVGVDVFFVISGFLITAHLMKEVGRTGTVRLREFWARRVRRLLPAALLVLGVTVVGVVAWLPRLEWGQAFREIIGSALYVQNWVLAADAVDYLAADNEPSPAQHYWSLSVEEQFYLVWPLLILLAAWIAGRRRRSVESSVTAVLAVVTLASFAASLYMTPRSSGAYFFTYTRAWEFGLGGLLALAGSRLAAPRGARVAGAWLGWAGIAASGWLLTEDTAFPGYAALLPVVACLLVLWAGVPGGRAAPDRLVALKPVQFTGDVSYSLYLWHWPLVVLVPAALGHALTTVDKLAILAGCFVLAYLSKIWVEDPVRTGFLSRRPSRFSYAAMVVAMAVVVGGASIGNAQVGSAAKDDEQTVAEKLGTECFGAAALAPENAGDCSTEVSIDDVVPDPARVREDVPEVYGDACRTGPTSTEVKSCVYGPDSGEPSQVVAMVGDSHLAQWFPAVRAIARERDWELHVFFKGACPFSTTSTADDRNKNDGTCLAYNDEVVDELQALDGLGLVITSSRSGYAWLEDVGTEAGRTTVEAGYAEQLRAAADTGAQVVAIMDTPRMRNADLECVGASGKDPADCGRTRDDALGDYDALPGAVEAAGSDRVHVLDMNDYLCTDVDCKVVVGDVFGYRDSSSHMSGTMASTMTPFLEQRLTELGALTD